MSSRDNLIGRDIESKGLHSPLLEDHQNPDSKFDWSSADELASDSRGHNHDGYIHTNESTARKGGLLFTISTLLFLVSMIQVTLLLPMLQIWPNKTHYPKFIVLGDWGRNGDYNQTLVADAMARKASAMGGIDFVVSTGDNFYESGLVSVDDPQFDTSFKNIYWHDSLQVPWQVALGNHDMGEADKDDKPDCTHESKKADECFFSPLHQLDVRLTQRDSRWHCERSFTVSVADGDVDIFFIDTTPMIQNYYDKSWAANRGGLMEQSWEGQLRELEARMARSTARWKLVVGHHPIRSNHRDDGNYEELLDYLEPLIIKYRINLYMAGHDHNLQHFYSPDRHYHQVTSGAGSATSIGFFGQDDSPFQYDGNGFAAVTMSKSSLLVEYMGIDDDEPLFTITVPRDLM